MKRFIAVLSGLLVLPAFAEVAPIYYDEVIEYADEETPAEEVVEEASVAAPVVPVVAPSAVNPRTLNRNASRAVPTTTNVSTRSAGNRAVASSRTTSNAVTARTATNATSRVSTRAARSATNGTQQIATTRRAMQNAQPAVSARASIVQTDTVNTPLYTGRVSSRASAVRARIPTISTVSTTTTTESAATTTQSMDELAQITDFCKAQYTSCMDNFCNVLDDNQGRCSCSKNIKNYAKTEEALKAATEALQDIGQQITYIAEGLSADQIESLFTQTEAEIKMQSTQDNTSLKNDLDRIKNLIVDVKSGTASSTYDSGLNFDLSGMLDFSFNSTGFDLSSLFGTSTADTSSISNQRGETLYKTAVSRCKASVLNSCAAQGVDVSIITNSYDLEIDKQCIAYERMLTDENTQMAQMVRNAKSVLQAARLKVALNKNVWGLRQCVNELDKCMQDDYVCGADYEYCLDPTGKYIVDGEIVVGSTPGYVVDSATNVPVPSAKYADNTLYGIWYYGGDNPQKYAWGATSDDGTLAEYINTTIKDLTAEQLESATDIETMSQYLLYKIGYNDGDKNHGMCMSILNKCQDYTYTGTDASNKTYDIDNNVVREYLQRTLTKIKVAQDNLIADHAENCITRVSSCLVSNNYEKSNNIAINACRAQIRTCMSVNGDTTENPTPAQISTWIATMLGESEINAKAIICVASGGSYDGSNNTCTCAQSGRTKLNASTGECECPSGQTWDGSTCKTAS